MVGYRSFKPEGGAILLLDVMNTRTEVGGELAKRVEVADAVAGDCARITMSARGLCFSGNIV